MLPLDLHVLSLSLAFILSQDQTLHCTFIFFRLLLKLKRFIVVNFFRENLSRFFLHSAIQVNLIAFAYRKNSTVVFFIYLVLILHFCCFQSFKELVSVFVETDCKVTTFFWIDKIFQKKYLFFFSNVCVLNSQATSLDCGCKVTAFSDTTKIFLCFFLNFFISGCFSKRKIFIFLYFLWVLWRF